MLHFYKVFLFLSSALQIYWIICIEDVLGKPEKHLEIKWKVGSCKVP